ATGNRRAKPVAPGGDGADAPPAPPGSNPAPIASIEIKPRDHRHMVGRPVPAARMAQYVVAAEKRNEIGRGPDMVEPAAAVGRGPVLRPVAPPRIELLL